MHFVSLPSGKNLDHLRNVRTWHFQEQKQDSNIGIRFNCFNPTAQTPLILFVWYCETLFYLTYDVMLHMFNEDVQACFRWLVMAWDMK